MGQAALGDSEHVTGLGAGMDGARHGPLQCRDFYLPTQRRSRKRDFHFAANVRIAPAEPGVLFDMDDGIQISERTTVRPRIPALRGANLDSLADAGRYVERNVQRTSLQSAAVAPSAGVQNDLAAPVASVAFRNLADGSEKRLTLIPNGARAAAHHAFLR